MKVVESAPQFWYLLEDAGDLILTVNCEHSFIGYDFTMKLSAVEVASYDREGSAYLSQLSEAINYSCPIARESASPYKTRNIDAHLSGAIQNAVESWKCGKSKG